MALSLEAVADLAAERLQQPLKQSADAVNARSRCSRARCRPGRPAVGRRFLLTNAEGVVDGRHAGHRRAPSAAA